MRGHTYLGRNMISIDQLANTMAGGNQDCTISGRLGYLYLWKRHWWSTMLMFIVDATFYSVDGANHCYKAYMNDPDESYLRGHWVGLLVLGIITIVSCLILVLPVWIYSLFTNRK